MNFKNIDLFLLDMDGTIYLDQTPIDGAIDFINELRRRNKKYVFLTNNSSKNVSAYIEKLNRLGFCADEENLFTSGQACGMFLNNKKENPKVYVVGTESLKEDFRLSGIKVAQENDLDVDFLVVGYDTELTYKKLENACLLLRNNVPFIATNCDLVCPIGKTDFIPDCGLFCHMLTVATGRVPEYIGKPKPDMINILLEKYGIEKPRAVMVGDRLYTDIASGVNAGINTVCVLSGEVTQKEIDESDIKPTVVLGSVKDILNSLCD